MPPGSLEAKAGQGGWTGPLGVVAPSGHPSTDLPKALARAWARPPGSAPCGPRPGSPGPFSLVPHDPTSQPAPLPIAVWSPPSIRPRPPPDADAPLAVLGCLAPFRGVQGLRLHAGPLPASFQASASWPLPGARPGSPVAELSSASPSGWVSQGPRTGWALVPVSFCVLREAGPRKVCFSLNASCDQLLLSVWIDHRQRESIRQWESFYRHV